MALPCMGPRQARPAPFWCNSATLPQDVFSEIEFPKLVKFLFDLGRELWEAFRRVQRTVAARSLRRLRLDEKWLLRHQLIVKAAVHALGGEDLASLVQHVGRCCGRKGRHSSGLLCWQQCRQKEKLERGGGSHPPFSNY